MSEAKVVTVVQARTGSRRLPGKVLAEIAGRPMIWHVLTRASQARRTHQTVLATSDTPSDDGLEQYCREAGFACERGSENDVLDRFYQAARKHEAQVVVRVTGDCPLVDPEIIDALVEKYFASGRDYVANNLVCTFPDGLDVEVMSMRALETAWREARQSSEREHVTPFIRYSGNFSTLNVPSDRPELGDMRWTVDEPADLELIKKVFARVAPEQHAAFGWRQALSIVENDPQLQQLNHQMIANEGFYRSLMQDERVPVRPRSVKQSAAWFERAQNAIPSATQTFSKGHTQFVRGVAPLFLSHGRGAHVWDVDGNQYLDYSMGLGPVILGHGYPTVVDAVTTQVAQGTAFSLPHPLEVQVAEKLIEILPCAEQVRFGKNGSDVTSGAVRVARAFTGRDRIACCGYHGWQDWYIATTTRNKGIPRAVGDLTHSFLYNQIDSLRAVLEAHPGEFAAVILEPVTTMAPQDGFLQEVQRLAREHGALLIFDEIITGFRWGLTGAQGYYGVVPDLACFGKAMANGFPLAAVAGRADVMQVFDEVFFSFTFGGEAASLAATLATLNTLQSQDVYSHTWSLGKRLQDGLRVLLKETGLSERLRCIGYPPRTVMEFVGTESEVLLMKSLFQQECVKRGVLFVGFHNISFSHTVADIDQSLRVYLSAMESLAEALRQDDLQSRIEGIPLSPVFRKV